MSQKIPISLKKKKIPIILKDAYPKNNIVLPSEMGYGLMGDDQLEGIASVQEGLSFEQLKQLDQEGYLIIPEVLDQPGIDTAISELWDILESVPHKPEYQLERPTDPTAPLSTTLRKKLDKSWIPSKSYGMVNEPPSFHTPTHWKLRQDPYIYKIYTQILGTEKIWCTLDRANIKLPGYGEDEFNHWDYDPWHPVPGSFQGIVNLTERHFRCVPGSNTVDWHKDFMKTYHWHSSQTQRPMVLLKKDQDPWNLGQILPLDSQTPCKTKYGCIRDIICPAGSIVIFSNRLMHSVAKNQTNKLIYALYLSFFPAGNRDYMSVYNKSNWIGWKTQHPHVQDGDTELGDRIRSYQQGTRPYRYPSGRITYYITSRTMKNVTNKRLESSLSIHPTSGKPFAHEPLPSNYVPPTLTALGRLVLGIDTYPSMVPPALQLSTDKLKKLQQSKVGY